MSAAEGASEASSPEQVSSASERANERASGPVLQSVFLTVLAHCNTGKFTVEYGNLTPCVVTQC